MMNPGDVVVLGGVRLPIGKFGGSLRGYRVYELGALAISGVIRQTQIEPSTIDEVFVACNRQSGNGPNPGRSAAVLAGLPATIPAHTINMACPAGLRAVIEAAQAIRLDECSIAIVCGMESMSTIPHILMDARWTPTRTGDIVIRDEFFSMTEPLSGMRSTELAEHTASKYRISRAEQEQFALNSHRKAAKARAAGWFDKELIPVPARVTKVSSSELLTADECIRADATLEHMRRLEPVHPDGTVTAATSSGVTDGAGALIITTRARARQMGVRPLASLVGYLQVGLDPLEMLEGPAVAIPAILDRVGMNLSQMDFIEVNEAFAVQVIANERALQWDGSRLNVHGGAIALGHPTGFTGIRLLLSAANALRIHGGEHALISVCGGGGLGVAMIIRAE